MLRNTILEAKDIWKGYSAAGGPCRWILQGVDLEITEGDFIAILGAAGAGKSALLQVLSFRDKADRGVVYFEGRLVGRRGEAELAQMRAERVWLINGALTDNLISVQQGRRLAAILIDDPVGLAGSGSDHAVLSKIEALTRAGIAVLIATRDPVAASRAPVIYRLSRGKLRRIKITAN